MTAGRRPEWEPEDLIEVWTLLEDDMKRLRNKTGAKGWGFALLLKSLRRKPVSRSHGEIRSRWCRTWPSR